MHRLLTLFTAILVIGMAPAYGQAPAAAPAAANPDDVHWARTFKKPPRSTQMGPTTGFSSGGGKPTFSEVKWHEGRLWMSGAWEPGVSATNLKKMQRNEYWYLWTWDSAQGVQPVAYYHSSKGGSGPDGVINDFLWLPDGRLVVAGEFTRLDNPGGTRYHNVNALAVYDPNEPTANKWKPLGTVQYNGTVGAGGGIMAIAYDPQGNDLYIGHTGGGIIGTKSQKIHYYDFDTGSYEPVNPGLYGASPIVEQIKVDTSTQPSTIYIAGKFQRTGGNGVNPAAGGTDKYSTGFAAWQKGAGWTLFPSNHPTDGSKHKWDGILARAADYANFDSVRIRDFLIDNGDIWIVGSFSEGKETGQTLRGIAKWDAETEMWVDPTGKGGVGRDVFSIGKGANGKLYFAGAFGGRKQTSTFFEGFKNGDPAPMVVSYDPASDSWEQLGSGLSGKVLPEARLTVNGNDVWVVGDFEHIGPENFGRQGAPDMESFYIARWNEEIDFVAAPPAEEAPPANAYLWTEPTEARFTGTENWASFPKPGRPTGGKSQMSGATGMDDNIGTPTQINGMGWHDGTLYFAGNWEAMRGDRWYVWSYHPENGWTKLAWRKGSEKVGPTSPPEGLKWHEGKMYVFGAISSHSGLAIYDPADGSWSEFSGTYQGEPVIGNAVKQKSGPINDIAWDSKTGDMYMVGSTGLKNPEYEYPADVASVIRVDKDGVYHPMGHDLKAEDPGKPIKGTYSIHLDERGETTKIYIGGTFNYYGPTPSTNKRMLYNIAQWDVEAQDWRPVGKGDFVGLREIDAPNYPEGLGGLPAHTDRYPTFLTSQFPRVREIVQDAQGNLYAAGSLGVVDNTVPVGERKETFGIAKLDVETQTWGPVASFGGFSRDPVQMSWLDEDHLLITGGFMYAEDWTELNGVAVLNVRTGALKQIGGGLMRKGLDQTIAPMIVHTIKGDEIWFGGLFDHAGVNANSLTGTPNPSNYVAKWADKNLLLTD